MTEMDELKPCPFCGERLERSEAFSDRNQDTMMHPDNGCVAGTIRIIVPKGNGVAHRYGYERELERISAWNRRPSLSPAGVTEEEVEALTKTFCGDKLNGGVLRDMAFTVWQKCQKPTHEDGNTDWFNDTLPIVDAAVEQLRAALEAAAKAQPAHPEWLKKVPDLEAPERRPPRAYGDAQPSISTGQGEAVAWSEEEKLAFVALGHHILAQSGGGETGFSSSHARLVLAALNKLQSRLSLPAGHEATAMSEQPKIETGWLCEWNLRSGPEWWSLTDTKGEGGYFTKDSTKALRFARKEDAEAYINDAGWTEIVATEHEWADYPKLYRAMLTALPHNQGEGK